MTRSEHPFEKAPFAAPEKRQPGLGAVRQHTMGEC